MGDRHRAHGYPGNRCRNACRNPKDLRRNLQSGCSGFASHFVWWKREARQYYGSDEKRGYRWRAGRRCKFRSRIIRKHHQVFMITLLTVFHVIVCIFLVLVVLLQQGKGADWSGAFGGGGSQTTFGARGAGTILSRATTAAAIIFMITSLALTILISQPGGSSVIREGARQQNQPQQQQPAPGQQQQQQQPAQPQQQPAQPQQQQQAPAQQQPQQQNAPVPPAKPEKK